MKNLLNLTRLYFLQYEASENKNPKVLEEIESNPIWQSMNVEGKESICKRCRSNGARWYCLSKTAFLKEAVKNLSK